MEVYVSIRPEQIRVLREQPDDETNVGHGMVTHLAWMGSYALYQIRLDSAKVIEASVPSIKLTQENAPGVDDEVYVTWGPDSGTVLPA
jgi:putrescine transport system ATP-binding protein